MPEEVDDIAGMAYDETIETLLIVSQTSSAVVSEPNRVQVYEPSE